MKWDVQESSEESISDLDFLSVLSEFEDGGGFHKGGDAFETLIQGAPTWSYNPYSHQGYCESVWESREGIDQRISYHRESFTSMSEAEDCYTSSASSSPTSFKRRKVQSHEIEEPESESPARKPKPPQQQQQHPKKRGPRPKILTQEEKKKKRVDANDRERQRMNQLNNAFNNLREVLPRHGNDRELSKFETIQIAKNYIQTLHQLVS